MNSYVQTLDAIFCLHISCSVIKSWRFTFKSETEEKAFCFSIFFPARHVAKILTFLCRCITARQRMVRYPFVHYSALFLRSFTVFHYGNLYFFMLHFFRYCTLFMLHFFHMAPFACSTFCVVIFSCCTLFMYCTIWCCTFTRCNVFVFDSSPVALCACCNYFLLQFVHIPLIPEV